MSVIRRIADSRQTLPMVGLVPIDDIEARPYRSYGAFNPQVDFIAESCKINRFGEQCLSAFKPNNEPMLAQPREADYDVELVDGGVRVTFRPTASNNSLRPKHGSIGGSGCWQTCEGVK
jgi:hypothetical protein